MKSFPCTGALLLLTACNGVGVGGSVAVETVPFVKADSELVYAAKFLCGTIQRAAGSPQLPDRSRDTAAVLVPGTYMTSVNIQNPWAQTVSFRKLLVEANPQQAARGRVTEAGIDTLRPSEGLHVDCWDISSRLRWRGRLDSQFVEGFVVLRSPRELQVTGVYSYKTVETSGG
jgi:hypothetical protein